MVYFTGDIHGDVNRIINDIHRLNITENDIIVILGDVGLNYHCNYYEQLRKKALNDTGVTIFCIHGNHERRPKTINTYKEIRWHRGTVYVEDKFPNLLFAKDGDLFDLDGYTALVIGGAYSVDKEYRLRNGMAWFSDEQPSDEIKEYTEDQIHSCCGIVDVVLSHTCPAKYIPVEAYLPNINQSSIDRSTEEWLDKIENVLNYGYWFCGHWHIDKRFEKMHFLMNSYETLPELVSYEITADDETIGEMKKLCKKIGISVDLAFRAFVRFATDPTNKNILEKWKEDYDIRQRKSK